MKSESPAPSPLQQSLTSMFSDTPTFSSDDEPMRIRPHTVTASSALLNSTLDERKAGQNSTSVAPLSTPIASTENLILTELPSPFTTNRTSEISSDSTSQRTSLMVSHPIATDMEYTFEILHTGSTDLHLIYKEVEKSIRNILSKELLKPNLLQFEFEIESIVSSIIGKESSSDSFCIRVGIDTVCSLIMSNVRIMHNLHISGAEAVNLLRSYSLEIQDDMKFPFSIFVGTLQATASIPIKIEGTNLTTMSSVGIAHFESKALNIVNDYFSETYPKVTISEIFVMNQTIYSTKMINETNKTSDEGLADSNMVVTTLIYGEYEHPPLVSLHDIIQDAFSEKHFTFMSAISSESFPNSNLYIASANSDTKQGVTVTSVEVPFDLRYFTAIIGAPTILLILILVRHHTQKKKTESQRLSRHLRRMKWDLVASSLTQSIRFIKT